eukprot:1060555-Prorocentrum_minimum.AAC.1
MKIRKFAETALVDPIICNVGRAGAANLDVIQVRLRICQRCTGAISGTNQTQEAWVYSHDGPIRRRKHG